MSLIPYGLEPFEEDDLRLYFDHPEAPKLPELARWSRIRRIFEYDRDDLEMELHSFYRVGLRPYAVKSAALLYEHAVLFPRERAPLGGAALVEWVERQRERPTIHEWVAQLYVREAEGTTTGSDRLLLDEVVREATSPLRDLVQRYQGRRDFLRREEARQEREAKAREPTSTETPARPKRKRRRWGELPPEPEVVRRRSSR